MPAEQSETDSVVEYRVRVAASPDTIFEFFTDPEKMVQWMGTEATLDPRPGGVCRINPAGHAVMLGEYVEVDRPHRLVMTWGWETQLFQTPPQSTEVEVSLTPDGEETVVHLAHRRLHPEAVAFHKAGWDHYLPRLALVASGAKPDVDPWRDYDTAVTDIRAVTSGS
jgi:uncharacterized protein YndB with AHSA1/START domain